jgi:hypothetical protein
MQALSSGLQLVGLVEDVHHFDDRLHDLLLEDLFHDHDCNVELELLDDGAEFLLR